MTGWYATNIDSVNAQPAPIRCIIQHIHAVWQHAEIIWVHFIGQDEDNMSTWFMQLLSMVAT